MRRDSRLSVALHVLVHLGEPGRVMTSEAIGELLQTNPVLVRRTLGGLREAGLVHAGKGHGGGWSLGRPLDRITLAEVYQALGAPDVFRIGPHEESPGCLVEQSVNDVLAQGLAQARAQWLAHLERVSVADVLADVHRRDARARKKERKETARHE